MSAGTTGTSIALGQTSVNWIICPVSQRWLTAVRRFSATLTPVDCLLPVIPADTEVVVELLSGQQGGIVLWIPTADNLVDCFERISQIAIAFPQVLQLAVASGLTAVDAAAWGEVGVSVMVDQPEQLPKLAHLIDVYFARLS